MKDLEGRIAMALERIGKGIEALKASPVEGAGPDAEGMQKDLEEERAAREAAEKAQNAQRQRIVQFKRWVKGLKEEIAQRDREIARLKAVNTELRVTSRALRGANAEGLGNALLINKAMEAELDALNSLRDSDRSELDTIIREIETLVDLRENKEDA
ncbi:hypothetical protein CCR78_13215 [Rhodovulum imhoffii]|nr:hypothetical protein [Rhodovulum imhoffii]